MSQLVKAAPFRNEGRWTDMAVVFGWENANPVLSNFPQAACLLATFLISSKLLLF